MDVHQFDEYAEAAVKGWEDLPARRTRTQRIPGMRLHVQGLDRENYLRLVPLRVGNRHPDLSKGPVLKVSTKVGRRWLEAQDGWRANADRWWAVVEEIERCLPEHYRRVEA